VSSLGAGAPIVAGATLSFVRERTTPRKPDYASQAGAQRARRRGCTSAAG